MDELDDSIEAATAFLVNGCNKEGKFFYSNLMPDSYNLSRHAGSMLSLSHFYNSSLPDDNKKRIVRETLLKNAAFLKKSIQPIKIEGKIFNAFWNFPSVYGGDQIKLKLGGSALGLIGLLSNENIQEQEPDLELLESIGEFMLHMQMLNGDFRMIYYPETRSYEEKWKCYYYPGQVALAYMMLNKYIPNSKWLLWSNLALQFLSERDRENELVERDHWTLISLLEMNKAEPISDDLLDYAVKIVKSMVVNNKKNGEVCPTACCLEGMLCAYNYMTDDLVKKKIKEMADIDSRFLMDAQIKEGKLWGGFPRSAYYISDRCNEVRIDYTRHSLSALLHYRRLFHGPD